MTSAVLSTAGSPTKADAKKNDPATSASSTTKKSNGKRKSASLPSETVEYLKAWMMSPEHIAHPYPTEQEKVEIMKDTGIELKQLTNWFVNNRKRYWKPRVEARLQQQAQAAQAAVQAHAAAVAAVSAANSLPQQVSSPEATRVNLVSPTVRGFKTYSQSSLSTPGANPPLVTFNSSSSRQPSFTSSPLTFAAQLVEQRRTPTLAVPVPSTVGAVHRGVVSSVASVSASEGEMSDSGNSSDDASSDGATILGTTDLKFVDLKMKKKFSKARTASISSASPSPGIPRQTLNMRSSYTRNVSFCSLDKISLDVVPTSSPQEHQDMDSKKRSLITDSDNEFDASAEASYEPSRKRFRTVSIDVWRQKCQDATHVNDEALPSLEEASRLFGFTSA